MDRLQFDPIFIDVHGLSVMFVLPIVPENAPSPIREGIGRRRESVISGRCPCGAERPTLTRQQFRHARRKGELNRRLTVEHEAECPALDDTLLPAVRAWLKTAP
jgi:hypothetical protein